MEDIARAEKGCSVVLVEWTKRTLASVLFGAILSRSILVYYCRKADMTIHLGID